VYAAHFVVLVFVASMLVCAVLMLSNLAHLLTWLSFNSEAILHGQAWRLLTYGLVNPPYRATVLWFAIDMLMLVWFGRELEKFFGRGKFLSLYVGIYLVPPILFTLLGKWMPTAFAGEPGSLAIFIAFATLYPNASIFFTLLAKWCAIVLVGIYTIAALAEHDWVNLVELWSTSGFAYAFVRYHQGHISLPRLRWPRRKPKLRVLPDLPKEKAPRANISESSMAEVDALLDKIAQSGIGSLTAKERAKLNAARDDLKRRSQR
jgi:hypothetical protein